MLEMLTGPVSTFILIPRSFVHSPETKVAHSKGPGAEQICWLTFLPAGLSPAPMAACLAALMPQFSEWGLQGGAEGEGGGKLSWEEDQGRGP